MTALGFVTSGGMASTGGSISEEQRKPISEALKLFGAEVRRLAFEHQIPASALTVWSASAFIAVRTAHHTYFCLALSSDMTNLSYQDWSDVPNVNPDYIVSTVRMQVGEVVSLFWVPTEALTSPENLSPRITSVANSYIQELMKPQPNPEVSHSVDPKLCFVIMSFSDDPQLKDAYELGVKPTIEKLGYRCERVDEQQFNGGIRERILHNIHLAKFIVADLSQSRPNCYYELGIAHAMNKEVIHIASNSGDIHFDVKDFNFIIYGRIGDLQQKLERRITATVGPAS